MVGKLQFIPKFPLEADTDKFLLIVRCCLTSFLESPARLPPDANSALDLLTCESLPCGVDIVLAEVEKPDFSSQTEEIPKITQIKDPNLLELPKTSFWLATRAVSLFSKSTYRYKQASGKYGGCGNYPAFDQ